jgi:GDP-L-fucose synthase
MADRPNSALRDREVIVTGGGGFLGSRIVAHLEARGAKPFIVRSADYDLTQPEAVKDLFSDRRAPFVIHAAAVVGGIGANREHPGRFFYENAVMGLHLIDEAKNAGVEKLVTVGTVCSYPKFTPVPFSEDDIWNGYPEETNAPYGLAKKMLLVQSQSYRAEYGFNSVYVIPTNLYGPEDNFDPRSSHVIPAVIRKYVEAQEQGAQEIVLWGSGTPSREFLYVDDAAEGLVLALEKYDGAEPINLGASKEITIKELAELIGQIVGFEGSIRWDTSQPDGQPRRQVDGTRANELLGWEPKTSFRDGLQATVDWFKANRPTDPGRE